MLFAKKIRILVNSLKQFEWLKKYAPIEVVHYSRRVRMFLWRYGGEYRNTLEQRKDEGKSILHILHISKTGGTAVKRALGKSKGGKYSLYLAPHPFLLKHVPEGDACAFFLRDPISRYVSSFTHVKLQGFPSYEMVPRAAERRALKHFETPNDLALAIYSSNCREAKRARSAMKNLEHVRLHYSYWLESVQYLEKRWEDVLFVGFQESLEEDYQQLLEMMGLNAKDLPLPSSREEANRTQGLLDNNLDDQARENLRLWYAGDYEIYNYCRARTGRDSKK